MAFTSSQQCWVSIAAVLVLWLQANTISLSLYIGLLDQIGMHSSVKGAELGMTVDYQTYW